MQNNASEQIFSHLIRWERGKCFTNAQQIPSKLSTYNGQENLKKFSNPLNIIYLKVALSDSKFGIISN